MARVALLTLSGGRDVVARDVSEACAQAADAVAAALISAGHEVVRVGQPVSASDVATHAARRLAANQPACLNDPYDWESAKDTQVCATEADPDGALTVQLPKLPANVRHCDADRGARDLLNSGQRVLSLAQAPAGGARAQRGEANVPTCPDNAIELVTPDLRTLTPDLCTSFASPTNEAEGHSHAS